MEIIIIILFLIFGLCAAVMGVSGILYAFEFLGYKLIEHIRFFPLFMTSLGVFVVSLLLLILINVLH